jgi:hypothetical protein
MKRSVRYILTLLATALMSSSALAAISFSDDFESYNLPDGGIIGGGWTWFLNAYEGPFPTCGNYLFGWGPNPAPNSNGNPNWAVSNIAVGVTGQALNVFSDYGSDQHPIGNCVETNVFQERVLTAADAGQYTFRFQTQVSDELGAGVQTYGFIKLIDPNNSYQTVHFETVDTATGGEKTLDITLGAQDAGLILQWGFANVASNYLPSGRWYDDVTFAVEDPGTDPDPEEGDAIGLPIPFWAFIALAGLLAFVGGSKLRSRKGL